MKKTYLLIACLLLSVFMANAQDRIYYGVPSVAISSVKFDGSDIKQVVTISGQTYDMETDYYKGILYWGEGQLVKKANINGTNTQTLATVSGLVGGVALDLTNNKLYFSRYTGSAAVLIMKCNLDGTELDTIVTSPISGGRTYTLSISPTLQKIYWTEQSSDNTSNYVYRCNLDGTNIETLMTVPNFMPGLAIDDKNQKLYLAYYTDNKVMTTDMTCSTDPTLVFGSSNGTFQMAIDNINNKLYFGEMTSKKIRKCNLDGTSPVDIVSSVFVMALSIPTVPPAPTILEDSLVTFKFNNFKFAGIDTTVLTKIQIVATVDKGTMYLDANNNNVVDTGEEVALSQEILKTDIDAGLLKFNPVTGEFGTPYTSFDFKWYDGSSYSTLTYTQYIYVTEYIAGDINQNGVIDGAEIAGDINNNGSIDRPAEVAGDRDGNGLIDGSEVAGDINGDFTIVLPEIEGDFSGNNTLDDEQSVGISTINTSGLTIYPTVSTGLVFIDGTIRTDVVIYDLTGIEVLRTQTNRVNLHGLQAGMYLLQANNVTQKIVLK